MTDLDATLLDKETYDWRPAAPALEALRRYGARVALCSSKTRAELRPIASEMGIDGPLIAENGAAGAGIAEIRTALVEAAQEANCEIRGFGEMSIAELVSATGLPDAEARLASEREFDEPFLLLQGDAPALKTALSRKGLLMVEGGRFWHVYEKGSKGEALNALRMGDEIVVALGDSENDRPMLEAADIAIVIPGGNLEADPTWRIAPEPGPAGWNRAVLDLLAELR